jgi:hypothetical protein
MSLLPQLQELNLKSMGLTSEGMNVLQILKSSGHLGQATILTDERLQTAPPHKKSRSFLLSSGRFGVIPFLG